MRSEEEKKEQRRKAQKKYYEKNKEYYRKQSLNEAKRVRKERKLYNEIIKEAIEYIKEYGDIENIYIPTNISRKTSIELLEILKGVNSNEKEIY